MNERLSRLILWLTACLCILMLAGTAGCSGAALAEEEIPTPWPVMTVGVKGEEVLTLKKRLYELGYFKTTSFTKTYSENTAETVRLFQQVNGLPETGEVDAATAQALFSESALRLPHPTLTPLATPGPTPAVDWPARDAEGFLTAEDEYFYENDQEGLWIYLGQNLQVIITARHDSSIPLEWFETEIITRNGEGFRTVMTNPERPGRNYRYPYDIARDEQFVLAFSDDFYANRMTGNETVGIIIREGQIVNSRTNRQTGHHLPNLDMMAQYPDGSLEVYECNELSAEELLSRGAINVFSFGPILLRDGEINELVYTYYKSIEPRHALGMIAPNHYFLLSVQGRHSDSKGTTLQRMAEIMKERGVMQALNLDGGNTMALIFRGRMLNKLATYQNRKFVRTVTSLIGIGRTEQTDTE